MDDNGLTSTSIISIKLCSGQQFYFGSLVAIYRYMKPEQLGITLTELYRDEENFKKTGKFVNAKCIIKRVDVLRAKQRKERV